MTYDTVVATGCGTNCDESNDDEIRYPLAEENEDTLLNGERLPRTRIIYHGP